MRSASLRKGPSTPPGLTEPIALLYLSLDPKPCTSLDSWSESESGSLSIVRRDDTNYYEQVLLGLGWACTFGV